MKLTIQEALNKGINYHQMGDLHNASIYYRSILQTHPNHPDANHNLGVLTLSVGKKSLSLPLFLKAVERFPLYCFVKSK